MIVLFARVSIATFCLTLLTAPASAAPSACDYLSKAIDAQPEGAVFLASYPTAKIPQLAGVAFTYDNAVATLALIGCHRGHEAARIGDAFVFALANDRYWHDGRLRNAYPAGAVTGRPVKLTGWWDKVQGKWVEDGYQVGSDTGNLAWAALALAGLTHATGDTQYLDGATRIATYLLRSHDKTRRAGFAGGSMGGEPAPTRNAWRSTEHNADLAALFSQLAATTHDNKWVAAAYAARAFVEFTWQPDCKCFAAGTAADGSINRTFALDAQTLPLLLPALHDDKRFAVALITLKARAQHANGYAYTDSGTGVWTEGTAQVALLEGRSRFLENSLERNRAPDGSYFATDRSDVATGFDLESDPAQSRRYFHLPHLGATAWVALAERGFNPFR